MDTFKLVKELLALCRSGESKFAEIKALLESLTEDERREVLRYRDNVSESRDSGQHAVHDGVLSTSILPMVSLCHV